MIKLINKANEEIKKVIDYIENNYDIFDCMNLKLHDASYYGYSKLEIDFPLLEDYNNNENSYFNRFCEDNYYMFIEDLQEIYNISFKDYHYNLGRTSSFYLHDRNIIELDINNLYIKNTIYNLLENYYSNYLSIDILDNGLIDTEKVMEEFKNENENYMESIKDELEYIIENLYIDFMDYVKNIKIIYDMIRDFKNNQVENFKEYLQFYNEEIEEETKIENKKIEDAKIKINYIMNKYNISIEDKKQLKELKNYL